MLVRVNQELIPKVLDIEATSERVVSSSKAYYHELIHSYLCTYINVALCMHGHVPGIGG